MGLGSWNTYFDLVGYVVGPCSIVRLGCGLFELLITNEHHKIGLQALKISKVMLWVTYDVCFTLSTTSLGRGLSSMKLGNGYVFPILE